MKVLITTSKHIASYHLAYLLKQDEVLFGDHFADFPKANSNSIAHQILTFCLNYQIQRVFPLQFLEVVELRKSIVLFEEFGIEVMLGADGSSPFEFHHKTASTFAELSAGLIALGYPDRKVAIANSEGRGQLITIDDAVEDNLQIWIAVTSVNFKQLGKWFNQTDFKPVILYQVHGDLLQFFVLVENGNFITTANLAEETKLNLKSAIQNYNLKGFCHVAIAHQKLIRIVNSVL